MAMDKDKKLMIEFAIAGVLAVILVIVMPLLNAYVPEGSFGHVSDYKLNLYGKYICYAILAISVDFLWGYTGLLCLGQAFFFALGGYALGMYLMLHVGVDSVYNTALPDFMDFLGYKELPSHWVPFESFGFAIAAVLWVPGLVALIFGYFAFRSRIKGVYFSILTQALTYAACLMFFRNDFTFGGNNGFTDFKTILGFDINSAGTKRGLYIASAVVLVAVYALLRWLSSRKFGKVQQAIRDSENRVLFSGYATVRFKLFVFVLCAMIAGIAGALYAPQVGIINPGEMDPKKSLEAVVWVAVGGRGTLFGAIIGAFGVNALKSYATNAFPEFWSILLGALFIFVVLIMPRGIVGLPSHIKEWRIAFNARFRKKAKEKPVAGVGKEKPAAETN